MRKDRKVLEEFVSCDCYDEGILLRQFCDPDVDFDYDDFVYVSIMYTGHRATSLRERLRKTWYVLKTGRMFDDQIVLNRNGVQRVRNFCNEALGNGVPAGFHKVVRPGIPDDQLE